MSRADMRRRAGLRQTVSVGLWAATPLFQGLVQAAGTERPRTPESPVDAQGLMRWVSHSTEQHSFTGTYVITGGAGMSSARIVHLCDGRNQMERVETLDGPARLVFRHNETVHVLWPATRQATVEQRHFVRRFPLEAVPGQLTRLDMYEATETGQERVAGHEATVVTFRARDALRFAQRWWIERKTGLLLRVDTFGLQGELIESAAFSELQIGTRLGVTALLQEMNRLEGYRVHRPSNEATELDREGWSLKAPVAGFQGVSTVLRGSMRGGRAASLATLAASTGASAASAAAPIHGHVLQAIFSDGLTHVSVFVEPAALHPQRSEKFMNAGATHGVSARNGDWWITAVGDVPPETLKLFVTAIERRRTDATVR